MKLTCPMCGSTHEVSTILNLEKASAKPCCYAYYRLKVLEYLKENLNAIDYSLKCSFKSESGSDYCIYRVINRKGNPTKIEFDNQNCILRDTADLGGVGGLCHARIEVNLENIKVEDWHNIQKTKYLVIGKDLSAMLLD